MIEMIRLILNMLSNLSILSYNLHIKFFQILFLKILTKNKLGSVKNKPIFFLS